MFCEKIGCVVLRIHSTHGSAEGLRRLLFVALFDCRHVLLGGVSPSSTWSVRCPATGKDESAEEDHPYTSPTGKLPVSKSRLCRRSVLLVSVMSRIYITMFRVIIQGYHRQLFSQLLFMMVSLCSREIFHLVVLLLFHGNNKLIRKFVVFVSATCGSDPLIISVVRVFCAYRLCVSRHASASGFIPFMLSSACILSSSALLYFFLVPIVLRELVANVICSPENFESYASSITVERLPGLTVSFEFRSLIESPSGSSNPELFVSLVQD